MMEYWNGGTPPLLVCCPGAPAHLTVLVKAQQIAKDSDLQSINPLLHHPILQ
jgi:hypothetical protein